MGAWARGVASFPDHICFSFFNNKRGARLISNEPRPRTFHLHEAGSYEALRGVPCGLARQLTTARTLRSEHDATKRSKPWWSWS